MDQSLVILSTAAAPLCWLRRFKSKAGSSHCSGDNGDYGLMQILICTNTNTNTMTNTNTNHFLVPFQILQKKLQKGKHPKKYLLAISDFQKKKIYILVFCKGHMARAPKVAGSHGRYFTSQLNE